jgi:hypothetical protein
MKNIILVLLVSIGVLAALLTVAEVLRLHLV